MPDPEFVCDSGITNRLRYRPEGDKFRVYLTSGEEEAALDGLLGAFDTDMGSTLNVCCLCSSTFGYRRS
jgi:hypothetical protein